MNRVLAVLGAVLVTLGTIAGLPALADTGPVTDAGQPYDKVRSVAETELAPEQTTDTLRVGVGEATLAFRAGAAPGQVGTSSGTSLDEGPYPYALTTEPGDGWHSEPTAKAFVVETADGERLALVKTDLYLMQHSIHKRVADLVVDETGIDRASLFLQGNHDHSHPYANSPSWGLCIFTDCFDARQWSYMTRQIADAIQAAASDLQPAEVGAAATPYTEVQRNVIGPACATTMANGTGPQRALALDQTHTTLDHPHREGCVRAGFPHGHVDPSFAAVRFDNIETGDPIGTILSLGMHPESLDDGHGLTSADYAGIVEDAVEDHVRANTGNEDFLAGWFVGALGDVEPASAHQADKKDWWRESFARMEDMADRMTPTAISLHNKAGSSGNAQGDTVIMEPSSDHPVDVTTVQLPPPEDQPWGPGNSYLTEQGGWGLKVPSTRSAQETTGAWLTAVRLGEVLVAGFPGEPITDLARNFETRTDETEDNVYQGYTWPTAPDWVRDRVQDNFAETEVTDHADGYRIPLLFGMANDWTGYYVTQWEYENRNHYRESMTPYGPESAEHVTGKLVEIAGELAGGPSAERPASATRAADDAALDGQYAAQVAAEQSVRAYRASIPPNQGEVGTAADQPADAEPYAEATFTWVGGSNAVDLPRVEVQRSTSEGWTTVADSTTHEVVVRMEDASVIDDPGQANPAREWTWTAAWEVPWDAPADRFRFALEGEHRTDQVDLARSSFFDPMGADRPYHATSDAFAVADEGTIPANDVRDGSEAFRVTFEPTYRNNPDPTVGTTIEGTLALADGSTREVSLTYTDRGWFTLDEDPLPAGEHSLVLEDGAWTDPAGNPSEAVELSVNVG